MHEPITELLLKTVCDPKPQTPTNGVYLFGQAKENQFSVIQKGVALLRSGKTENILIAESDARSGYPGFQLWNTELLNLGVPEEKIIPVPMQSLEIIHTNNEALTLVKYCQSIGFKTITITAPPFHQLRAFMSVVSALVFEKIDMQAYNVVGANLSWYEESRHSQGTLLGTREDFITSEFERIKRYHKKGDLLSVTEVLGYLRKRDR